VMRKLAVAAALLLALSLPAWAGGIYYVNLASQVLIAALFALSLNLLVGYAGLISLGQAGYLGLSAYIAAWLMLNLGWSHASADAAALLGTAAVGAVFGIIALRASGIGFLMITLALGQILWGLCFRWSDVTGGDNGLSGITRPHIAGVRLDSPVHFYYYALGVFMLCWVLMAAWIRSPFGASIRGTRDQPRRMAALGYNVFLIRWITFTVSVLFTAAAGVLFLDYNQFISPQSMTLSASAETLLMVIAGGPGTSLGPVVGALLVVLLKEVASDFTTHWVMLLGVVYVLIVMYVPGGLVAGASRLARRLRRGGGRAQPAAQEIAEGTPGSPGDSTAAGGSAS
jgi:branched-chain amino acid transport system permease protein